MRVIQLFIGSLIFLIGMTIPQVLADQSVILMHPANSPSGQDISRNWSGYVAQNGTFTGVFGTWTIPEPITNDYGADAAWVGIGGATNQDLIQAGTQGIVNREGQISYQAFYELLPDISQPLPIMVNGGDTVTVSINQQSNNEWNISFADKTTGQKTEQTVFYASSLSSAEWIEEAPSGTNHMLPLDYFGSIQFSNGSTIMNGQAVNILQANARSVTMVNELAQAVAVPSDIGTDGASFTITRSNRSNQFMQPIRFYHPFSQEREHFRRIPIVFRSFYYQ